MTAATADDRDLERVARQFLHAFLDAGGLIVESAEASDLRDLAEALRGFREVHETVPINLISYVYMTTILAVHGADLYRLMTTDERVRHAIGEIDGVVSRSDADVN